MIKHSAGPKTQHHELTARFERLRDLLLTDRYEARLKNPLQFWALPADRRLPRALMHRPLGDLLRTSFASLAATPGIGFKKMQSLLTLLDRALNSDAMEQERLDAATDASTAPINSTGWTGGASAGQGLAGDPSNISEVTWAQWRGAVLQHRLGDQPLGRFAQDLHELPRVIWSAPLSVYAAATLEEIRRMKTHGEKRVRAIVSIFGQLHARLTQHGLAGLKGLTPQRIDDVDAYVMSALRSGQPLSLSDLRTKFVLPLVEQIRLDAGPGTADLVLGRIGWEGQKLSVRRAAMKLKLTRARIYQLLEDAETVIAVRRPGGLNQMKALLEAANGLSTDAPERRLLTLAAETFYATEYRPQMSPPPAFLRRFDAQPAAWPTNAAPLRPMINSVPTMPAMAGS
jgi:hypothetical protein